MSRRAWRNSDGASIDVRNTWLAWAAEKVGDDSGPYVPHQNHELDMQTFLLDDPEATRVRPDLKAGNIL